MTASGAWLVTGATGFIGSVLARRIAAGGARVVCPVRAESARMARLDGIPGVDVVALACFGVAELRPVFARVRPDVVVHLAAYGVAPVECDPEAMLDGNAGLTARLLIAAGAAPPRRFVHAGSCSEYAPAQAPHRIAETHPLAPASLYGAAKAGAYLVGTALAAQLGIPFVTARLFGVYGAGEAPHRLIPHIAWHLRHGRTPELTPGGQARDLTHVDDVVEALMVAATAERLEAGRAYNVCSGEPVLVRDVAAATARLLGCPGADLGLGRRPYRDDEPMWMVGDGARFREATGWAPRIGLEEGIGRALAAVPRPT